MTNLDSGSCETGCNTLTMLRKELILIAPIKEEYCYSCAQGCKDCEALNSTNCLSCKIDFYMKPDKKCVRFAKTNQFLLSSIITVFLIMVFLGVSIGLWLCLAVYDRKPHKKKTRYDLSQRTRLSEMRISERKTLINNEEPDGKTKLGKD